MLNRKWLKGSVLALLVCCGEAGHSAVQLSNADSGKSVELAPTQALLITLQAIGPGSYDAPTVSSAALRFVEQTASPEINPAGPRQVYRFVAAETGTASVTIPYTRGGGGLPEVEPFTLIVKVD